MAHVSVADGLPGIAGLLVQYPETGRPLRELAQVLLRGPSSLSPGEREVIATFVSALNDCFYCTHSHRSAASHLLGDAEVVDAVVTDREQAPISSKLRALLAIAEKVQRGGRSVSEEYVAHARQEGATDQNIHDTVLIAAAFCMYNRYVDGLATAAPQEPAVYDQIGARLAANGYTA